MGIRNIEDLKPNPIAHPEQPSEAPAPENTESGTPATPLDNVAEQQETQAEPDESATGGDSDE